MAERILISVEELKEICIPCLLKIGVLKEHAEIVVETLLEADLRGVTSHGIRNLPVYIKRIQNGGINVNTVPEVKQMSDNVYIIDGKGGLGQIAAFEGIKILRESAERNKTAVIGVKNSNHCGMLAYYTKRISSGNSIGFMCSNTNPNMAAYGGAEPVLGTNPFSVAVPYRDLNIILDMATSSTAKGKIYEHDLRNEPIPEGWALDTHGNVTTSPEEALKGILLPFGGHKGYSLALMIEILSGVLTGSGFSIQVHSLHRELDKTQNVGFLMGVIPIKPFMDLAEFTTRMEQMVNIIKNSKKQRGIDEILLPGEMEERVYKTNFKKGILVDKGILEQLKTN